MFYPSEAGNIVIDVHSEFMCGEVLPHLSTPSMYYSTDREALPRSLS